ncbi:carbohydrate ABC transporter permease [Caldanaerobius polysaccharolyticus]|uniref:carbohydrate ABC transporter permease n=1 Tax=Caldanaerobius polysaccharolyticus TaxID=44256 RepID=UPI0006913B82|nr:carbohydrate ABC transporter permease [Caldanaerobius polysaccharolyticus]
MVKSLVHRKDLSVFWRIVNYFFLTLCGIIFMIPFLWMIATSLKPSQELFSIPPKWFGSYLAWGNYKIAWNYLPFGRFYINSIFVSVTTTILVLMTSSMAAYAFARIQFPARDTLFAVYLGTLMIPFQVTMIPMYILMKYLGWLNSYYALIIPGAFTAFGTFLLRQFFLTIPMELEEAAFIEGCSRLKSFLYIILPLGRPAIASLAAFTFIGNWNSFLWPLVVTDNDFMKTLPVGVAMFIEQYGVRWELLMAGATIAVVPPLILFMFVQKYFVEGITVTGMGGR